MTADAIIEVRFKTSSEGGRRKPIAGEIYSCPLFVDGQGFDCRISLHCQVIEPGKIYKLPVRFLSKELVMHHLKAGTPISLWEGKEIAEGKIQTIIAC